MKKTKKAIKKWTAEEVVACVRSRYDKGIRGREESVVFEQLANGTGAWLGRWIDVAVFDLWPSKGCTRRAIEVKVSRQDFLHELAQPEKHAWARECFHEFWFAAPPGVLKEEELPDGAGWMKPRGQSMVVVRAARRKDNPECSDMLMAALARNAARAADDKLEAAEDAVLAASHHHQNAMAVCEAVHAFLVERRGHGNMFGRAREIAQATKEETLEALREASMDKELEEKRGHAYDVLGDFRRKVLDLFGVFAPLAYLAMHETDEAGKQLLSTWGGTDDGGWTAVLKRATTRKASYEAAELAMRERMAALGGPGSKRVPAEAPAGGGTA